MAYFTTVKDILGLNVTSTGQIIQHHVIVNSISSRSEIGPKLLHDAGEVLGQDLNLVREELWPIVNLCNQQVSLII